MSYINNPTRNGGRAGPSRGRSNGRSDDRRSSDRRDNDRSSSSRPGSRSDRSFSDNNNRSDGNRSGGFSRDRPSSGGYSRDKPRSGGFSRDRPSSGGFSRDRPSGNRFDNNKSGNYSSNRYDNRGSDSNRSSGRPSYGGRSDDRRDGNRSGGFSRDRPSSGGFSRDRDSGRSSYGGRSDGNRSGGGFSGGRSNNYSSDRQGSFSRDRNRPSGDRPSYGGRSDDRRDGNRSGGFSRDRPSSGGFSRDRRDSGRSDTRNAFSGNRSGGSRSFDSRNDRGRDNNRSSSQSGSDLFVEQGLNQIGKFPYLFSDKKGRNMKLLVQSVTGKSYFEERSFKIQGTKYREVNPERSKLFASVVKGISQIGFKSDSKVLYLGASHGYTVSFLADMVRDGEIYALDFAPRVMRDLTFMCDTKPNMAPIMADANHPELYAETILSKRGGELVPAMDVVFMDISQRNQREIFIKNCDVFLKKGGFGLLTLKARSVDVTKNPKTIFEQIRKELEAESDYSIVDYRELSPLEIDHAMFVIKKKD